MFDRSIIFCKFDARRDEWQAWLAGHTDVSLGGDVPARAVRRLLESEKASPGVEAERVLARIKSVDVQQTQKRTLVNLAPLTPSAACARTTPTKATASPATPNWWTTTATSTSATSTCS